MSTIDTDDLLRSVAGYWNDSILERLCAYIRIPNQSPMFDPEWQRHGYMDAAVQLMADWCAAQAIPGMRVEVRRLPQLTPLLVIDVPGELPAQRCSTGTSTSNPSSPAGTLDLARGSRCCVTANSMDAAVRTTATRYSVRSPPSWP